MKKSMLDKFLNNNFTTILFLAVLLASVVIFVPNASTPMVIAISFCAGVLLGLILKRISQLENRIQELERKMEDRNDM